MRLGGLGLEGLDATLFVGAAGHDHHLDHGADIAVHGELTRWEPSVLIGSSSSTLRRSIRILRACQIASEMSVDVTEPYSRSSVPARRLIVSTVRLSVCAMSRACSSHWASCRRRCSAWRCASATRASRRGLGQLARAEIVAQVAGGDVDHVALAAELLDVLEQDRLCASLAISFLFIRAGGPRLHRCTDTPGVTTPERESAARSVENVQLTA